MVHMYDPGFRESTLRDLHDRLAQLQKLTLEERRTLGLVRLGAPHKPEASRLSNSPLPYNPIGVRAKEADYVSTVDYLDNVVSGFSGDLDDGTSYCSR